MVQELAKAILQKGYVCDNCLGRQFGQLLSGMTNKERGRSIRTSLAMSYSVKPFPIDKSNFQDIRFRKGKPYQEKKPIEGDIRLKASRDAFGPRSPSLQKECRVCGGLFDSLGKWADEAARKLKPLEYRTFVVSSSMSRELIRNEESVWEEIGIEHCEPMKAELNRELGKLVAERTGKEADEKSPDVSVMLDLENRRLDVQANPLFIYGSYQKLARGLPQTKWEGHKETVEEIIARPFMKETEGISHSLHASGREDMDARCMDWRPFVLEIGSPRKRVLPLAKIQAEIAKTRKVKVSGLRYTDRKEIVAVKSMMPDKTYRVLVTFGKPVPEADFRKLKSISAVKQQTPTRVAHRRADLTRSKRVKSIAWKLLSRNRAEFIIKGEAGLYVKELVSGDSGRTRPSISSVLGVPAKTEELDVVKIHLPGKRPKK